MAWHFHNQGRRYLPQSELLQIIADFLPVVGLPPDQNAGILEEIASENGLLKEQAHQWYGFLHLTLQEYFVALSLADHQGIEALVQHIGDPWWEEIFFLYAGHTPDASPLLQKLLGIDSKDSPQNSMHFGANSSPENAAQAKLQDDMLKADVMPVDTDQHKAGRLKAYQTIEQELVNQVAWLPTQQQLAYGLRKPCVQGVPNSAMNIVPPDEWSKIYISKNADCVNATVS